MLLEEAIRAAVFPGCRDDRPLPAHQRARRRRGETLEVARLIEQSVRGSDLSPVAATMLPWSCRRPV